MRMMVATFFYDSFNDTVTFAIHSVKNGTIFFIRNNGVTVAAHKNNWNFAGNKLGNMILRMVAVGQKLSERNTCSCLELVNHRLLTCT